MKKLILLLPILLVACQSCTTWRVFNKISENCKYYQKISHQCYNSCLVSTETLALTIMGSQSTKQAIVEQNLMSLGCLKDIGRMDCMEAFYQEHGKRNDFYNKFPRMKDGVTIEDKNKYIKACMIKRNTKRQTWN